MSVRTTFPNPGGVLRCGATGRVRIPQTVPNALLVLQAATSELQGKRFVFVVEAGSKVKYTEITVLPLTSGQHYVVSQGLNKARLRVNQAQQQEAQLNFQTSLLTGGQEASNALYSYQAAGDKVVERTQQLNALRKSVTYSQALLKNGFANYTEVLKAQQNLLAA